MCVPLETQIKESTRFLVSGIIENGPCGPQRWCNWYDADSARQAEDFARQEVEGEIAEGRHGNLWVANVFQLQYELGKGEDHPEDYARILQMDTYAKYVNPDQTDEIA